MERHDIEFSIQYPFFSKKKKKKYSISIPSLKSVQGSVVTQLQHRNPLCTTMGYILFLLLVQYLMITSKLCLADELPGGVNCIDEERRVLLTFKHHLTDPSGRLSSWSGYNCCQWNGLSCENDTGHIVKMDLRNPYPYTVHDDEWNSTDYQQSCLSGKINPSLLSLKNLYYLDLSWNDFQGIHIPNFMGRLTSLNYLNLSYAAFSGEIPHFLGNLSNLNYLAIDYSQNKNNLDETPSSKSLNWLSHLSSLKYLNLGGVDLSGAGVSWLHSANMLPSLLELHLSACSLDSNQLPLFLPTLNFTSLSVLDMSENLFNSSIPSWFSSLISLRTLYLNNNWFSGPIPNIFASFKNLEHLDLSVNGLEGPIPKLTGNYCTLKTLSLAANLFDKEGLRDVLSGLADCSYRLESLDLSSNFLESELPASIGMLHSLQYLNLKFNSFFGSIPESIGNLLSLRTLILLGNSMNGTIPEILGQLSQLVHLDLSQNLWEGILPETSLINLTKLEFFAVGTDKPMPLIFNVTYDFVPPFQLSEIHIENCLIGDAFPLWLQSQTELSSVTLSGTGISSLPEDWLLKISSKVKSLDFSNNQIQGKLPFQSIFPKLLKLDLSRNRFSKSIPLNFGQIMPSLQLLYLYDNHLDGTIPPSICEIQHFMILVLRNNQLSGEFPRAWSLWSEIHVVDVSENSLSGNIPSSMGVPSSLYMLKMNNNNFGGEIPSSLQNCTELSRIDLGGNNFTGNLPSWIGSVVTLRILQLRSNFLSGHIPRHLCNLSDLNVLELADNNFSGTIPKCLKKMTSLGGKESSPWVAFDYEEQTTIMSKGRELEYGYSNVNLVFSFDLSSNNLEGEIPEEICSLIELGTLNLSRNHLHGKIPSAIGNLSSLETLDLSHNLLSGEIPQSLSSLNYLSDLNLSYNNFSGRIPLGNQLQTLDDPFIYEANPSLCGFPLSTKCPGDDKPTGSANLPVQDKDEDDNGKLGLYVSIVLGFIIGFWGVCGTLLVKTSWRYAYFRFFDNIKVGL